MRKESKLLLLLGILVLALAFMPGCSDDDDPVAVDDPATVPEFELGVEEQIDLPVGLTNSDNSMAMMVAGYMSLANSLTG